MEELKVITNNTSIRRNTMRKFAFICMLIAIAAIVVAPAIFACDKDGSKASASSCSSSKVTTASATDKDNAKVAKVGASCTAAEKAACAAKTGTTAGATCQGGAKTTTAGATLPNGHPDLKVADALQCGTAMVAFVNVEKMTCGGCVSGVNKAVGSLDGVCAVETSLDKKMSTIVFHPDKVKTEDLMASITKAGFVASMKQDCTEDMKAVFGANYDATKCAKVCANSAACSKKETKTSES
jgi:copper chaperone CopZ